MADLPVTASSETPSPSKSSSWMLRSPLEGLFFDLEAGRTALLNWARWHVKSSLLLSAPRSLLLNPEGGNVWRLWQLVQRVPTLQSTIMGLFSQQDDEVLGEGLARAIDCRLRAEERFVGSGWLHRLDLESVGFSVAGEPWFTGFAPYLGVATAVPRSVETDQDQLLRRELAPLLRDRLELEPRRIPSVLASLRHQAVADGRESVAESIQRILLAT